MYIEELKGGEELGSGEEKELGAAEVVGGGNIVVLDAKRVLVGAGARALFYPTLLYNVVRNRIQTEFRWWDRVDEFVLLGAVPFPTDVKRLKELGVCGVITLNEPYETLVPTSLYQGHGIDHLVLPTRDYLYAPSLRDICMAVDFIHKNASRGLTTYVHCKAGRGRSTTIVICYLVQYKQMMPDAAYAYVKSIRPRVLLASSQWQAVMDFYHMTFLTLKCPKIMAARELVTFDDSAVMVINKEDLDGYDSSDESVSVRRGILADLRLVYRVRVVGQAAFARLSCLLFRCHSIQNQKIPSENVLGEGSSSISSDQQGAISVNIHVY